MAMIRLLRIKKRRGVNKKNVRGVKRNSGKRNNTISSVTTEMTGVSTANIMNASMEFALPMDAFFLTKLVTSFAFETV